MDTHPDGVRNVLPGGRGWHRLCPTTGFKVDYYIYLYRYITSLSYRVKDPLRSSF